MSDKDPTNRLVEMLGFDPGKGRLSLTQDVMKEVTGEFLQERADEAKKKAKELIREAMELRASRVKAEREFNKSVQKFDKSLGRVMAQIEALVSGQDPMPDPEDETTE